MKHVLSVFFNCIVFLLTVNSLKKLNQNEPILAYIPIEGINIKTDDQQHGNNSSEVSPAFIYLDEKLFACFEITPSFGILNDEIVDINIQAGVRVNKITVMSPPYLFPEIYVQKAQLRENTRLEVNPVVMYRPYAKLKFMGNFKCNHQFVTSIYEHTHINTSMIPVMGITATENRNKMYVYLTPSVSETSAIDFNIYVERYDNEAENRWS